MNATVTDITRPLDLGLSHIALVVHNIDASLAFYPVCRKAPSFRAGI
ncbi:VOC family protein [Yersinia ruckeri]|nr:hypothetical protein [Yersinia ruckeri]ARZ01552.1 hypothetical protein QMA0440_02220 [Yersinia ruckeri]MCW6603543.1 hypothetical protein [Yersinia ruckeri]UZY09305.1 hypothetical protein LNQ40_006395 [Yersinia ruckeri]CNB04358.1 Uncharacterised protein [Yersinia ruckeri]